MFAKFRPFWDVGQMSDNAVYSYTNSTFKPLWPNDAI